MSRVVAHYLIETAFDPQQAAEIMAAEQSVGTFVKVPGETPERVEKYGARVETIELIGEISTASLEGASNPQQSPIKQAKVSLSFPLDTIGTSLVGLWTAVAGNLFELSPFSGLKLDELELPPDFTAAQSGPQFGIEGTRKLAAVYERPIIGTIIKPSVGLSAQETADLVKQLAAAGLDFVKDDELQANSPHSPLETRVKAVMKVVNENAEKTGKKLMIAFNISGEIDDMLRHHDLVLAEGGNCVMVNMLAVGLAAVSALRKHSQLPIHGHRAGWGMLARHPLLGMSYPAFSSFYRLAGVDQMHVNGLNNKFCEADASVIRSAKACLKPLNTSPAIMPVFSSGQTALQVPSTFAALGSTDLMYLAGGGIMGHPDGAALGVESLKEAWAATLKGISLTDYAQTHKALAGALRMFGK